MGKGVYGAYGKSVYVRGEDPKGFSPDPKCLAEWEMECVNGDTYMGAYQYCVRGACTGRLPRTGRLPIYGGVVEEN